MFYDNFHVMGIFIFPVLKDFEFLRYFQCIPEFQILYFPWIGRLWMWPINPHTGIYPCTKTWPMYKKNCIEIFPCTRDFEFERKNSLYCFSLYWDFPLYWSFWVWTLKISRTEEVVCSLLRKKKRWPWLCAFVLQTDLFRPR